MGKYLKPFIAVVTIFFVVANVSAALAAPPNQTDPPLETDQKIMEVAWGQEQLETFVQAVQSTGLIETLDGEGPFTVFAPTDDAFAALSDQDLSDLMIDSTPLEEVLQYHVVSGEIIAAAEVDTVATALSISNQPLEITFEGDEMRVNGALVILPPGQEATNGILYIIDRVLMPPEEGQMMAEGQMEEAETGLPGETESPEEIPPDTPEVMAADDAPAMCVQDYEVQADDWLSKIAEKFYGDPLAYPVIFEATNEAVNLGADYDQIMDVNIIEIGQTLCIPDEDYAITLQPETQETGVPSGDNIVDALAADGRFNTLVAALNKAGLEDRLQAEGPYTLFAPTDDAFDLLPGDELATLMDDTTTLSNVLIYHVVPETLQSDELAVLDAVEALLGGTIDIAPVGDTLMINEAQVIDPDIPASNGVIHAIDTVLQPADQGAIIDPDAPAEDVQTNLLETLVLDGRFNTLFEALQEAELSDDLTEGGPYTVFAPTDGAFAKMGDDLPELLQDLDRLTQVLQYHVVTGEFTAEELAEMSPPPTPLLEQELVFTAADEQTMVNGVSIIDRDIEANNGLIHAIDTVLMPPE